MKSFFCLVAVAFAFQVGVMRAGEDEAAAALQGFWRGARVTQFAAGMVSVAMGCLDTYVAYRVLSGNENPEDYDLSGAALGFHITGSVLTLSIGALGYWFVRRAKADLRDFEDDPLVSGRNRSIRLENNRIFAQIGKNMIGFSVGGTSGMITLIVPNKIAAATLSLIGASVGIGIPVRGWLANCGKRWRVGLASRYGSDIEMSDPKGNLREEEPD